MAQLVESRLKPVGMAGEIEQVSGIPPAIVGVWVVIAEFFTKTNGFELNDSEVGNALSVAIAKEIAVVVAPEKFEALTV